MKPIIKSTAIIKDSKGSAEFSSGYAFIFFELGIGIITGIFTFSYMGR